MFNVIAAKMMYILILIIKLGPYSFIQGGMHFARGQLGMRDPLPGALMVICINESTGGRCCLALLHHLVMPISWVRRPHVHMHAAHSSTVTLTAVSSPCYVKY